MNQFFAFLTNVGVIAVALYLVKQGDVFVALLVLSMVKFDFFGTRKKEKAKDKKDEKKDPKKPFLPTIKW